MNADDLRRTSAQMKSYTGSAIVVLILYWIFWIPGLIANVIYYQEAKRMEKIAGHGLPGVGCLTILLLFNVIIPAGICLLTVTGGGLTALFGSR